MFYSDHNLKKCLEIYSAEETKKDKGNYLKIHIWPISSYKRESVHRH